MRLFVTAVLLLSLSLCGAALTTSAPPRQDEWKKVRDAMEKGLPKTAIETLRPIAEAAVRDKAYDEAIKALAMIAALESNVQGNKPEEKIVRFQAAMETAPEEMQPMMEVILGHWYWHFFQRNRWRFMQRTQTDQPAATISCRGACRGSWKRSTGTTPKHWRPKTSCDRFRLPTTVNCWPRAHLPDAYRPTLYDFVAHEALDLLHRR